MSNKQIIISKGDFGINFEVQILDKDKLPMPIIDETILVNIIYPDKSKRILSSSNANEVSITDAQNGIIVFTLEKEDTAQEGNYSIYLEAENSDYDITTTTAINYYVVDKNGGVS